MYTKPQSFREYCLNRGVELLRDDIRFINTQIANLEQSARRAVLSKYCEVWLSAMNSCDTDLRRMNIGRKAANSWLRGCHERENRTHNKS